MTINEKILYFAEKSLQIAKEYKNYFHKHPELSLKEYETKAKIIDFAKKYELPYEEVGECGLIVKLVGKNEENFVVLRADMDALPILESQTNLCSDKKCISVNAGVSHACGHDAHMAIALGCMDLLFNIRDSIDGTVLFAFESGEEVGGGNNYQLVENLRNYNVKSCFATHVSSTQKAGTVDISQGPRLSAIKGLKIRVTGKGGHASRPDHAINPLMCASQMITNLGNIWINELDPTQTVTLGITTMSCGTAFNVIPDYAIFEGCIRYFDKPTGDKMLESIKRVCESIATAHRCEVSFEKQSEIPKPVINDEICSLRARNGVKELLSESVLTQTPAWFASETYSEFVDAFGGVMAFLGINDEENGFGANHHTKEFDMNPEILKLGILSSVKYLVDTLNN